VRALRRFCSLSLFEQQQLVAAVLILVAIRAGLLLLPFRVLRRCVSRLAQPPGSPPPGPFSAERTIWAVKVAACSLPGTTTCLARALAAQVLLARQGHLACLRIGIARSDSGSVEAHAWLESHGRTLIGEFEPGRYLPLPVFDRGSGWMPLLEDGGGTG
jgi:hypothetical protein